MAFEPHISILKLADGCTLTASGLLAQWLAGRKMQIRSVERLKWAVRSSRAMLFPRHHSHLLRLDTYRRFIAAESAAELFHHLGGRHYLSKRLDCHQRTRFSLSHARIDSQYFDMAFKEALHRGTGLQLWHAHIDGVDFSARLYRASRRVPEGDMCVSLMVNDLRLHSMSFSWIDPSLSGEPAPITPFLCRSQGRWRKDTEPLERFERAFPQNSPSYFCYAALQGIARAVGASRVIAIRSVDQFCHTPEDAARMHTSYDEFWGKLGGRDEHWLGYRIPVPFHSRPLNEVPSKHRKRAMLRRAHWQAIEDSSFERLRPHLLDQH